MPNLKIQKERFFQLMGQTYEFGWLQDLGFQFGIQVEQDFEREKDGKIIKQSFKFDCMNNRPDLLSQASLVRAFKIYLSQITAPMVTLSKPTTSITIDPSVQVIRPFVAGAVLRGLVFDDKKYKAFIAVQQKLHDTFCRARKYASIGTHDLSKIKGPFTYTAKPPTDFKFVPLNQQKQVNGLQMMQLLQNHKLKEYLPLIRESPVYPLVLDSEGRVCSVPPIINSDLSKITMQTRDVFIQVTALNRPKAMVCLNTVVWAFAEYTSTPFQVQPVQIIQNGNTFITPNIQPRKLTIRHEKAQKLIGAKLSQDQIIGYLKRSGISATYNQNGEYSVQAPFWRGDVLHECDVLEDIAICFGYTKITPVLPPSATVGGRVRLNKFTDFLRHELAQAQYNQMLNFALCSKAEVTSMILNEDTSKLITISNAKTKEFQTGRTSLLPGLLRTVVENKSNPLPYRFFEAGDCIVADGSTDTGSRNYKKVAALLTDEVLPGSKKGIFSQLHGVLDLVLKKSNLVFGKDYRLIKSNSAFYFPGQQFDVQIKGQLVGSIGVVHPEVLRKFGWLHPTSVWELDVSILQQIYTKSYQ